MLRTKANRRRRLEEDPDAERKRECDNAARYRARKRQALVEKVDREVVWERDEGICGLCGLPVERSDWHLDHVVPLARGGEHSYANVQVAHPICNQRKGAAL